MPNFLDNLSFVTFSSGSILVEEVLDDWIHFLEGRPREIIFAVPPRGQAAPIYEELKTKGKIDRLIYLPDKDWPVYKMDNYGVRAAAEAVTTEWALFAKLDTLPYRNGHNGWLEEAMQKVATDGHMGLTGGFCGHTPYRKLKPVGESYATSNKFSNNFTIMRISEWLEIEHRDVGPNFDGPVPLSMGDAVRRFADEVAIERVMEQSRRYLLVRLEDIDWSVFHVNQWGETLRRIRIKYLNREKVGPHLCSDTRYHWKVFDWQLYYEHPEPTLSERLYQYARYLYGRIRLSILWLRDRSTNR